MPRFSIATSSLCTSFTCNMRNTQSGSGHLLPMLRSHAKIVTITVVSCCLVALLVVGPPKRATKSLSLIVNFDVVSKPSKCEVRSRYGDDLTLAFKTFVNNDQPIEQAKEHTVLVHNRRWSASESDPMNLTLGYLENVDQSPSDKVPLWLGGMEHGLHGMCVGEVRRVHVPSHKLGRFIGDRLRYDSEVPAVPKLTHEVKLLRLVSRNRWEDEDTIPMHVPRHDPFQYKERDFEVEDRPDALAEGTDDTSAEAYEEERKKAQAGGKRFRDPGTFEGDEIPESADPVLHPE